MLRLLSHIMLNIHEKDVFILVLSMFNGYPRSVTIEDINNDSLFDIIVASYGTDYVEILSQTY